VIDRVGGVEICVDYAVQDPQSGLDLPAGCTNASGAQALAWLRSRHTRELVGGRWRVMPGVNDLARNQRQQDIVIQALVRLKGMRNISELAGLVDDLADAFVIDERLGLGDAVSLAWELRSLDVDRIVRFVIPTQGMLAPAGESVLRPLEPFEQTLRGASDDADAILGT
jgi:anionic cell wall polymer biosynthesis LytR-Cps2A-Psr (LCP) family protein